MMIVRTYRVQAISAQLSVVVWKFVW